MLADYNLFIIRSDYAETGFLALQYAVDSAIILTKNPARGAPLLADYKLFMQRMPYPPVVKDPLIISIQRQLPLFLILGFILSSLMTVKSIVYEKEKKLKVLD